MVILMIDDKFLHHVERLLEYVCNVSGSIEISFKPKIVHADQGSLLTMECDKLAIFFFGVTLIPTRC